VAPASLATLRNRWRQPEIKRWRAFTGDGVAVVVVVVVAVVVTVLALAVADGDCSATTITTTTTSCGYRRHTVETELAGRA
jgi:hypothetical protein